MQAYSGSPFLNCGKVCKNCFSDELIGIDKPINLAFVKINTKNIKRPYALINYSQNLEFEFSGSNPKLSIVYRLIRKSNHTNKAKELESWNYKVSEVIPSIVQPVNSIEPLVLNFCDDLSNRCDHSFTYIVQIVEITTENTSFNISNQEISAIVSNGKSN